MKARLREAAGPAFLFICLLAGGSAQGIWANLGLQILAILIVAWAVLDRRGEALSGNARSMLGIFGLALIAVAIQLIPLPYAIWSALPGREVVVEGYRLLGQQPGAAPISLAPHATAVNLLWLLPPLAMFLLMVRLRAYRPSWIALALVSGTFAGILLGALQVVATNPQTSPWYLYKITNRGFATGFFANSNHMATLLMISLPFLAALLAASRTGKKNVQRSSAALALAVGGGLVILIGIMLNGSLAAYGLVIPVLAGSALILLARRPIARWLALGAGLLLVGSLVLLMSSPLQAGRWDAGAANSVSSRQTIFETTTKAAADFAPIGSGLGTFAGVYALYEGSRVEATAYVNHAHNDYLELAVELGLPGIIVLLLFLGWWAKNVWSIWRYADSGPYSRAATIASAAILLHSLVDFPLRTVAISASLAACLAFMVATRRPLARSETDLWPARHLSV